MPAPVLLIVAGTRSEALSCASLVARLRNAPPASLPFETRLLTTGQEETELLQALEALGLEADEALSVKRPHLADANLDSCLIDTLERAFHRHAPTAVLAVGCSASAWAAAVTAYFKRIPLIHLGAGVFAPPGERPYPEWFHRRAIAQLADLHLCPDAGSAESLKKILATEAIETRVVGEGSDEALALSLSKMPAQEDPTLHGFRPDAPRALAFVRRREHHANALRPLCQTLDALSLEHADHDFAVAHSLQSYICDALVALIPRRQNLRDISPLPHPAFVREIARARLVITDSAGTAREALLLGRPLILIGSYARTESLDRLAASTRAGWTVAPMERAALESAAREALGEPAPAPATGISTPAPAGERAAAAISEWWKAGKGG